LRSCVDCSSVQEVMPSWPHMECLQSVDWYKAPTVDYSQRCVHDLTCTLLRLATDAPCRGYPRYPSLSLVISTSHTTRTSSGQAAATL
jgi:hypothetical protein